MKKKLSIFIIILACFTLSANTVYSQHFRYNLQQHDQNPYHFGFYVSVNQMNFSIQMDRTTIGQISNISSITTRPDFTYSEFMGVINKPTVGFTLGLVGNLKINELLDLRFTPGLAFGERTLDYTFKSVSIEKDTVMHHQINIVSTHVDFPFSVKFKSKRAKNFRAYVLGGGKFSIDLASRSERNQDNLVQLNRYDFMAEFGVGFDYYMSFFKFGIELKMSYGFNELKQEPEVNDIFNRGIRSLRSKNFMISLTFE